MNFNPTFPDMLRIALNNYRMFGAWHTAKSALAYWLEEGSVPDHFDRRYRVQTAGSVEPSAAGITNDVQLANAIRYVPIREQVLSHLLAHTLRGREPASLTFVDLGCGKGRALLIAARFAFRQIIGVELSASHVECAAANVASYLAQPATKPAIRCRDIHVVCESAPAFIYPDSDLLVYLYRPFTGATFTATLDSLAAFAHGSGRAVTIVLCCPSEEYLLERHPNFRKQDEYQVISQEFSWVTYAVRAPAAS
jgi:SAM-dependent methyltransferase